MSLCCADCVQGSCCGASSHPSCLCPAAAALPWLSHWQHWQRLLAASTRAIRVSRGGPAGPPAAALRPVIPPPAAAKHECGGRQEQVGGCLFCRWTTGRSGYKLHSAALAYTPYNWLLGHVVLQKHSSSSAWGIPRLALQCLLHVHVQGRRPRMAAPLSASPCSSPGAAGDGWRGGARDCSQGGAGQRWQ